MENSVLQWLCESGGLLMLQEQCKKYKEEAHKVTYIFTFHHTIEILLLLEHDAILGELVLHHPSSAWPMFQKACYLALTALKWLPPLTSPSQLVLLIRLLSMPSLPGYVIKHSCDLTSLLEEPRFYHITGTVCSISNPEKYSEHAVFSCPTEGCGDGEDGSNYYVSVHVAGASEASTVGKDWTCFTCGAQLTEKLSCRQLEDKMTLIVVPYTFGEIPMFSMESCLVQGVSVIVRRDLCKSIRPGSQLTIIGVPTHKLTNQIYVDVTIEANNLFMKDAMYQLNYRAVPEGITDMLKDCSYSPWVFLSTLAFHFAADICPPGCYQRLKMALLLSLVGTGPEQKMKSRINLLMFGSDSVMIRHLVTIASSLASTCVHHNSLNDLVAVCRKSQMGTFIDGGSLLLANEGVCTIMNLSSLKKEARNVIQKGLETNHLVLTLPKQHKEGTTHEFKWRMCCTIWAHVDQHNRKKADLCDYSDTSGISRALTDLFDLVVMNDPVDECTRDHLHDIMMDYTLKREHTKSSGICLMDLQQLLKIASSIEVTISEDTSELLKSYYTASRKVRVSVSHSTDVPIGALNSMNALASAHAKINFRQEVLVEDAVMAIYLYEESLTSRCGYSVLGLSPCPHFKPNTESAMYIGKEFDAYMKDLHKQIVDFCSFQGLSSTVLHEE